MPILRIQSFVSVVALLGLAAPALAQGTNHPPFDPYETDSHDLAINYDVNMGGFTLGNGELRARMSDTHYQSRVSIRTSGLAEWLFDSRYTNTSQGYRNGSNIYPEFYTSDFRGGGDDDFQVVRIAYEGTTPYLVEATPSYGPRLQQYPVAPEQRENSFDPLNAAMVILSGMEMTEDNPCGERVQIFDGRRRYDIVFEHQGTEDIRIRRGRVWDGPAIVCAVNYEEVAGFKPQPEDDELPRPPMTIFIAEVEEGYFVPMRVRAPTPIGTMVMVATHYEINEVPGVAPAPPQVETTTAAPVN